METNTPPEDWTTSELFEFCKEKELIDEDAEFENWKHDRSDLLKEVNYYLDNN